MNRLAKYAKNILLYTALFLTLYPFLLMFMSSFKNQKDIIDNPWFFTLPLRWQNYSKAFGQILGPVFNSLIVTAGVIAITIIVSSLAAYSFMRYDFPLKNTLYFGIIALLMIPGFVMLIPQFIQVKSMGMYNSYLGLIFPPAAYSASMATHLTRTFFEGIPKSLIEAAEIEGANDLRIFSQIVMPLSKTILATVSIITGLAAWNNYIWPLVITSGTKVRQITIALTLLTGNINEGEGLQLAGYVIATVPLILLFIFANKYFVAGLTQGAVKS